MLRRSVVNGYCCRRIRQLTSSTNRGRSSNGEERSGRRAKATGPLPTTNVETMGLDPKWGELVQKELKGKRHPDDLIWHTAEASHRVEFLIDTNFCLGDKHKTVIYQ